MYSKDITELAIAEAKKMIASGEKIKEIPFGWQEGSFWLTTNKNLIIGTERIDIDGIPFYIGLLKATKRP